MLMAFENGDKELLIRLDEKLTVLREAFENENAYFEREIKSIRDDVKGLKHRISMIEDNVTHNVVNKTTVLIITLSSSIIGALIGALVTIMFSK